MNNSIFKIWVVIMVLIVTFGGLLYWGAKNYSESTASIKSIVSPNLESAIINSLYKSIIQSDLYFNSFILTGDSIQWRLSTSLAHNVDSLIVVLENTETTTFQQHSQLDTLRAIIAEKSRINSILKDLKNRQVSQFFTEQALNRIKTQISDSAHIDKSITSRQDLITKRDTIERIDIIQNPDNYKGMSGFFRKIFGKERITVDTIATLEEQINYGLSLSVDSSIVRDYYVDTTLMAVRKILIDVLDDEVKLQRSLHATELELISYNVLLLNNIRELLDEISIENEILLFEKQETATSKIENAQKQAFIIAGVGTLLGFVMMYLLIRDITQSNSYRQKLEKEKERAERLATVKEVFLSKMSHEIRTPLHSISGLTELLGKELKDENNKKILNGISISNNYLIELISNILEQAKINSGNFQLEHNKVYVPALCSEFEIIFDIRQKEQNNTFKINYSENLKSNVIVLDRVKIKQVLINLISNAFKFTKNGEVSLDIQLIEKKNTKRLEIKVADTGIGIDTKYHASIFQPFNQVEGNSAISISGSGLGLSITKHIVEHFGGDLMVESQPGKGSIFSALLPVTIEPYRSEPEPEIIKLDAISEFYPLHVLAIEDDNWNAYLLENFLSGYVQSLKICHDAESALEMLAENPNHFNLILTDLNLPKMSGKQFFKTIADSVHVPVVALSADLNQKNYQALIDEGFAGALGKPFNQSNLLGLIGGLFESEHLIESKTTNKTPFHIDLSSITQLLQGNPANTNQSVNLFMSAIQAKFDAYPVALQKADVSELARISHQLRSTFEQLGILEYSERLHTIETLVELGKNDRAMEEASEIWPSLQEIETRLQEAVALLDKGNG